MDNLEICKPFYLFREFANITDTTEDAHRASQGLCSRDEVTSYNGETFIDVWDLVDGDLSKVGVKGENVYREDLRKSVSIRDRFTIRKPAFLRYLFKEVKVGVGSKHIYTTGDFMAPHRDARLPDFKGLPHVMTLVVLRSYKNYNGGDLLINDVNVMTLFEEKDKKSKEFPHYYERFVLFPITSMHEITPLTAGSRHSFVFPVFGHLDLFRQSTYQFSKYVKYTTKYDEILAALDKMVEIKYGNSEFRGELLGMIETLSNWKLSRDFVKIRMIIGDFVPSERANGVDEEYEDSCDEYDDVYKYSTNVTYTLNGNQVSTTITDEGAIDIIPDAATQVTIRQIKELVWEGFSINRRIADIKDEVTKMKQVFDENIELNREVAQRTIEIDELPEDSFIYVASTLYYSDATAGDLIGDDAYIYSKASRACRKIVHRFVGNLHKYVSSNPILDVYIIKDGKLTQITSADLLPDTEYIDHLHAEHDDQGGYDCEYERLHCCLVIGHAYDVV